MLARNENSLLRPLTGVPLKDKVVLLLDGANQGGRSLAVSLAKYGADIAIVYRQARAGHAQATKEIIEAKGRRCLVIQAQTKDESFPKKVVRQTINALGRLDIFIDYSDLPSEQFGPISGAEIGEQDYNVEQSGPFINVGIMSAVIDQMARTEQINNQDDEPNEKGKRE